MLYEVITDENGGSDFAKMCIRFYLEYKDKVVISSGVKQVVNNFEKKVDKSKVNKLFK